MTEKDILRKRMRELKRQFTGKELGELSLLIINKVENHKAVARAETVLMYHSLPDEVDTHDAVNRLAESGKTVLLPKVTGESEMELRIYRGEGDLRKGAFGIMEPSGELFTDYDSIDVAIIPGMAFDAGGNRLGRGKGYYDRLLARIPDVYKIGICFDFQKVESVPADINDIKMDEVI